MDTTATMTTTPPPSTIRRRRVLSVAVATLAGVVVWVVAVPLGSIELLVRTGGSTPQLVGIPSVVVAGLLASLLGWVVLALLERFVSRARTLWTAMAVVALLLSLAGPISAGTTTATALTLSLMHVVVGMALMTGLRGSSRIPRAKTES